MDTVIDGLRARWLAVIAITVGTAIGIQVSEPDYNKIQAAKDAAAFVHLLDEPGRAMLATGFDLLFAAAYGTLGVIGLRAHGVGTRLAAWGTAAVVIGAASDEVENVFVLTNIARRDTLTDGWVDAMQVPGTTKWIAAPGILVLFAFTGRAILRDKRRPTR